MDAGPLAHIGSIGCPLIGMCGKPASRLAKIENSHRARGGRQDVRSRTVQSGSVNEHGSSVRRLRAVPISVCELKGAALLSVAVVRRRRGCSQGVLGALCGWPVSAASTLLRIISLSW